MRDKNDNEKKERKSSSSKNKGLENVNPSENQQEILERAHIKEEPAGSGRTEGARPERVEKGVKILPHKKKSSKD
ncbi:hypothetical protein [Methanobacterium sp.]|uniref:hypothetical protein n=1 Tax=Methanobacterium sp. TaxID=2164 RepID=UPI003C72692F